MIRDPNHGPQCSCEACRLTHWPWRARDPLPLPQWLPVEIELARLLRPAVDAERCE